MKMTYRDALTAHIAASRMDVRQRAEDLAAALEARARRIRAKLAGDSLAALADAVEPSDPRLAGQIAQVHADYHLSCGIPEDM